MQRQYRYVIHTVGPDAKSGNREALKKAIRFALDQTKVALPDQPGRRLTHIAIPIMCASAFGDDERAMREAELLITQAITTWLEENEENHDLKEIRLVALDGHICSICMDNSDDCPNGPLIKTQPYTDGVRICGHIFHRQCLQTAVRVASERSAQDAVDQAIHDGEDAAAAGAAAAAVKLCPACRTRIKPV